MASSIKAPDSPGLSAGLQSAPRSLFNFRSLAMAAIAIFIFLLFFFRLGSYPFFDVDEPRYAEAAREMLVRHNWVTPYFNDEVRFDKPVFFYWLVMLAYQWFGVSEFAARFFSAVAATLMVGMTYLFGRYWISQRYGLFAGLILATSALFVGLARMSITDMTLSLFMTATSLSLFMAAHHNLRWWLAAGLFAGLAVLTKGPVGILVPGAIFVLYAAAIGQFKRCLLNRWLPLALLICLAVALPWYILAYRENGQAFLNALFLHNFTRFSDTVSGHDQPIYFYIPVLLGGFLPWTASLPAAVHQWWRQARSGHRQAVESKDYLYLIALYALVWTSFIFVFFTVSNTKLLTYILPLFPALALLSASAWLHESWRSVNTQSKPNRWMTWPAWLLVLIAASGGLLFMTQMEKLLPREALSVTGNEFNVLAVVILLLGLSCTAWLLQSKRAAFAFTAQVVTMVTLMTVAVYGIIPNINQAAQGTMLKYLARVGPQPLLLYELQRPSLTFYARRRIPRFDKARAQDMIQALNSQPQSFIITKNHHLKRLSALLPATLDVKIVEKDRLYSLLSVSNPQPPHPQMEPQP